MGDGARYTRSYVTEDTEAPGTPHLSWTDRRRNRSNTSNRSWFMKNANPPTPVAPVPIGPADSTTKSATHNPVLAPLTATLGPTRSPRPVQIPKFLWLDRITGEVFRFRHGHPLKQAPAKFLELVKLADPLCANCRGLGWNGPVIDGKKHCFIRCGCTQPPKGKPKSKRTRRKAKKSDPVGRFIKLTFGVFGIKGKGKPPQPGEVVRIETKDGRVKKVTVAKILWEGEESHWVTGEIYNWQATIIGQEPPDRRQWCEECGRYAVSGSSCLTLEAIGHHIFPLEMC
jgi:hypothetical protein